MQALPIPFVSEVTLYGFRFGKNGLIDVGGPDQTAWRRCGEFLKRAEGAVHFWIGDWLAFGERAWGTKYTDAIRLTGFDATTLRKDKWVASRFELYRWRYNLSFSHYEEVAKLSASDQDLLLEQAANEHLSRSAFRQRVNEFMRKNLGTPELPTGEFDVIYADPPWKYELGATTPSRQVEKQYPTMELEEICALKIPSADSAILFLWTTVPKLEESFQVVKAWNFEYCTHAIWDKEIAGMGHWFRIQHEPLLVGIKGAYPTPLPKDRISSILHSKRKQHSKKPDMVYELIEKMYPRGRYLELFARNSRPNWTAWGNQLVACR